MVPPLPKPRDVVRMLMTQKADVVRDVRSARGAIRKNVRHFTFTCPRGDVCKSGGTVVFEKSTGFSNPFKHLRSCLADGDGEQLIALFSQRRDEVRRFGGAASPMETFSASKREQAMFMYIRLIVLKSLPLSFVEDDLVSSFSKSEYTFSQKLIKSVIFHLTEHVEKRISALMQETTGAIVHDGWSNAGMHYFGVFASFMRKIKVVRNGESTEVEELCLPLLSVSPMAKVQQDGTLNAEEAETFDAEIHLRHLEETFKYYEQDVRRWAVCSIADNCPVNKRIASLLNIPHVGCMSHKVNSEVKFMVKMDKTLENIIDSVHATMLNCKRRLTHRAMLKNLTDLAPLTPNETRWSGMKRMLCRFLDIRD